MKLFQSTAPSPFFFSVFLLIGTFSWYQCANAPGPDPRATTLAQTERKVALDSASQAVIDDYDHFFSREMANTQTPGAAVVIVVDSQIVFIKGYGKRVFGRPEPVDENTVFRIGSLSKGFAGVLTGRLVQENVFHWDDPVQQYYPEFTLRDQAQAKRIRLWHLLSHTTGLPYHAFTNLIEKGYDTHRIISEFFPKAPVCGAEGAFFSYQNVAFCAIEEVMKKATGQTYQELLTSKIFRPAGMRTASCDYSGIRDCTDKACPHIRISNTAWVADSISTLYYNTAAAGGVNASIADMGEWLKVLLGYKPDVVSPATLDKVFTPVVKTGKERRIMPHWIDRDAAAYAMGWRVLQHKSDTIIYHGGFVNGYKGEIAFDRNAKVGICVLFNAATELSGTCIQEFFERWQKKQVKK